VGASYSIKYAAPLADTEMFGLVPIDRRTMIPEGHTMLGEFASALASSHSKNVAADARPSEMNAFGRDATRGAPTSFASP
jgi:hypothetical protein